MTNAGKAAWQDVQGKGADKLLFAEGDPVPGSSVTVIFGRKNDLPVFITTDGVITDGFFMSVTPQGSCPAVKVERLEARQRAKLVSVLSLLPQRVTCLFNFS